MLPNCMYYFEIQFVHFQPDLFFCRNCLAANNWREHWTNCSCLPECDSIDYAVVNREYSSLQSGDIRILKVVTYVNKSRIKRDLLFSIDYLVGRCTNCLLHVCKSVC